MNILNCPVFLLSDYLHYYCKNNILDLNYFNHSCCLFVMAHNKFWLYGHLQKPQNIRSG